MACIFTAQAENDLESIADYIALDNPARALSFVGEIRERCHRITNALQGFPFAPEYGENVHTLPFSRYLMLYTFYASDVIILHITHSARQVTASQVGLIKRREYVSLFDHTLKKR